MVGIFMGLFLAIVLVFVLENLDVSISTIEDIEGFLKLPVLGLIPNILSEKPLDNWLTQFFKKERYTVEAFRSALIFNKRYASSVIEAYHTLRTNIVSNLNTKESFAVVFSSAGAAEGKTLSAVNFALASANSGLKTLLIDADLRRPAIYQIFGLDKQPGLSDVLSGRAEWPEVVTESADFIMGGMNFEHLMRFQGVENLKIMNCGATPANVVDLLDSWRWEELMTSLKSEFDVIVFDAPPVLLFIDSVILAKHTDGVVLVYKAGKIARGALRRAKEQITGVNARMIGVVLNGVRASEMGPQYGYYYYDYNNYVKR
jgi:tyrosine-protein kinase Etk/Wzc